ncbi:fliO [Wigglesworthia glossinidia endosymbiont of Glossina brevipalpis]|uniref:Flagellar protein n=1 Tax=Wigglesworthia glossinidia brevipalpis TaxID=36870 RepID=Q8D3F0_WIGBR|nr:fliO [Wigglesworthia glossinidia endosymbiont of Glossina brevipalpis]
MIENYIFKNFSEKFSNITVILILFFCIIYFLIKLIKHFGFLKKFNNKIPLIEIKNSLILGDKGKIIVVQVGQDCILLGITPNHINYLCTLSNLKDKNIKIKSNNIKNVI